MNRVFNRSLQLVALLTLLVALPSAANPIHPYSEPISLGDRAIDINDVLEVAFAATPWTLVQESDELYRGDLSYRGYDVQARISVIDNTLTMTLDSITETGCGGNCKKVDPKRASGWLVSLRRNITFELTERIRDSLQ